MTKKVILFLIIIIISLSSTSCLTCEKKEYVFQVLKDNKIRLTIKYLNIFSSLIDSVQEIDHDYDELINMWLEGDKIERDFPKAKKVKKRLYVEKGELNGEITMTFDNYQDARLYRYLNNDFFMFSMSSVNDDGENFFQSNGDFGGDMMPVVFWSKEEKILRLVTKIATPDSTCVSMASMWENRYKKRRISTP